MLRDYVESTGDCITPLILILADPASWQIVFALADIASLNHTILSVAFSAIIIAV